MRSSGIPACLKVSCAQAITFSMDGGSVVVVRSIAAGMHVLVVIGRRPGTTGLHWVPLQQTAWLPSGSVPQTPPTPEHEGENSATAAGDTEAPLFMSATFIWPMMLIFTSPIFFQST